LVDHQHFLVIYFHTIIIHLIISFVRNRFTVITGNNKEKFIT
jgi:hypothetical protein